MSEDRPTLRDVLEAFFASKRAEIRTILPALVVSYQDTPNPTATVQLTRIRKATDGTPYTPAPLPLVPVVWPRFAGATARGTLQTGDIVILLVFDRELAQFLLTGAPALSESERTHDLSDAVVVPLGVFTAAEPGVPTGGSILIGTEAGAPGTPFVRVGVPAAGGDPNVEIDGAVIQLGTGTAPAPEPIVKAASLATFLAAAAANAATAAIPNDGGAAAFAAFAASMADLVTDAGSTKTIAQ